MALNSLLYNHLYAWYEAYHRALPWRETSDPYAIWLSEIILQQTRVLQGLEYWRRFMMRWPDAASLAAAEEEQVLREWQGLGYYSRARNLHKAAQMIVEKGWLPFPTRFEDIRSLPGVGEYTAGAIASFAYNMPYPAMDGNVYRVIARLMDIDTPFDTTEGKKIFRRKIADLLDTDNPRLFNTAIMEFGALYCTPSLGDNCSACPLQYFCAAHARGTADLLPVRKPRPKVRDRWFNYHIYLQRSAASGQPFEVSTLIQKRENPKDIWYHLYDFPYEELPSDEQSCQQADLQAKPVCELVHILSHQRIHARYFIHTIEKMPEIPGTILIPWDDLDHYALSRLTLRALDIIRHKG